MICVKVSPVVSKGPASRELPMHVVDVPCSKYIANRLLVLATLAKGRSILRGVPQNEDIAAAVLALKSMQHHHDNFFFEGDTLTIRGVDGCLSSKNQKVYTSDNGTLSRIMAPLLLLSRSRTDGQFESKDNFQNRMSGQGYVLLGSEQMNQRPMKDLFGAMEQLGAEVHYQGKNGYLPVKIKGKYRGGECFLSGSVSSQYFSALLLSAPYAEQDVVIRATSPLISASYVEMTIQCMRDAGAVVTTQHYSNDAFTDLPSFHVVGGRQKVYRGLEKTIDTDPTAASYFMAMAALRLIRVRIERFPRDFVQGEVNFYKVLKRIGCQVRFYETKEWKGSPTLEIIPPSVDHQYESRWEIDVRDMTDVGPTILVLAVALGHLHGVETNICGVAHLRYKESNRVEGMVGELRKIGAKIDVGQENIKVMPAQLDNAAAEKTSLDSLGDHRLAMSFSLLSLITGSILIKNEKSVNKTFPHFFEILKKLGFVCTSSRDDADDKDEK